MTEQDTPQHPDAAAIRDWALYGPRDSAIAHLIERLAYERGMRLEDIELLITDALTIALQDGIADPADSD
ncbi:MAG: hypothetical protein ACK5LJ_10265 [Paracoccus sp. (in: a-proteobacteria)]